MEIGDDAFVEDVCYSSVLVATHRLLHFLLHRHRLYASHCVAWITKIGSVSLSHSLELRTGVVNRCSRALAPMQQQQPEEAH